ncbi:unnamed protein product [Lepeophtheirus salmonis]|uniref:(salmon louse) hypothetical protein n=1 Tax=Lepeophtheirus salmonis TaxID=72036 RepID=A0A7R8H8I8_LEPSM|nr:unnamed protein product [Lepeophtheirus salmonis]CAF2923606.1 unnamed protein product [Lepeophtheirus salmonis]
MQSFIQILIMFLGLKLTSGIQFRPEQFTDLSEECRRIGGRRPIRRILDENTSAAYLRVDPGNTVKRKFSSVNDVHRLISGGGSYGSGTYESYSSSSSSLNLTFFDCTIHDADKFDALSLIILELNHYKQNKVHIHTFGDQTRGRRTVTEAAHYSDRVWASTNPNFLLSGQLSGFDSIDYRSKINPQHIVKPEGLRSSWDQPASITVNLTNWNSLCHIYLIFTSYKYLKRGGRCQKHKEFDCSSPMGFLGSSSKRLCMSVNLACDGLPNCGQDFLPNQDENCFKVHWSSVLLSLVSYILLAVTLLLCLSCFARVLIQWSVRSSLAELRGGSGGGGSSPGGGSFRSSSRFFSFLGTTFVNRWDRPPPTYDEAMKHVNPDHLTSEDIPPRPPTYDDSVPEDERRRRNETPPPEYRSREALVPRGDSSSSSSCPTLTSVTNHYVPSSSTFVETLLRTSSSTGNTSNIASENLKIDDNVKQNPITTVEAEVCVSSQ